MELAAGDDLRTAGDGIVEKALDARRMPVVDDQTGLGCDRGPKLLDEPCPICGKPMVERRGRYGLFKSCSDYPSCPGPKGVKKAAAV